MQRGELAALVADRVAGDHVVVCGLGSTSRAWREVGSPVPTYYASDPMGLAPGLALGFALASPEREVLLLEGDGDLTMNLGVLLTIAGAAPPNLRIVVFHNRRYETGGGQPIAAAGRVRLGAVAEAAGLAWASERNLDADATDVAAALDELFSAPAPGLLVVGVASEASPYGGPGEHSGVEERAEFQRQLRATATRAEGDRG